MSENLNEFKKKFKVNDLILCQTEFWTWSLRPVQCTVGAGILSLNRPADSIAELKEEEFKNLKIITNVIEDTLKEAFNFSKINYLMLMMVDSHVHFHVIPRYSKSIEVLGDTWTDESWPNPPILSGKPEEDQKLLSIKKILNNTSNEINSLN